MRRCFVYLLALAGAAGAWAQEFQELVNFSNTGTFLVPADRKVYFDGHPLVGSNYVAALYFGFTPTTVDHLAVRSETDFSLASAVARFRNAPPDGSAAGTWQGSARYLPGTVIGQGLIMEVRVWDMVLFATFDEAVQAGGICGKSAPFDYLIPTPVDVTGLRLNNFRAFALVPEPSMAATLAAGTALLMASRWWTKRPGKGSLHPNPQPRSH